MATMASGLDAAQGSGAAMPIGYPASWGRSALARQSAAWIANLQAMRLAQQAWRPEALA